jgi:hypothetical protein
VPLFFGINFIEVLLEVFEVSELNVMPLSDFVEHISLFGDIVEALDNMFDCLHWRNHSRMPSDEIISFLYLPHFGFEVDEFSFDVHNLRIS